MDIVYVLGRGSRWNDNELRYSLRSLQMFCKGVDQVYIIGQCPAWVTNVFHVPHPDPHKCKERNIMEKVLRACKIPELSTRFLFMNDDHFALGEQDIETLPAYRGGPLSNMWKNIPASNHYKIAVWNTMSALTTAGFNAWNFDIHVPMIFDKQLFPLAMKSYDWEKVRGYVVKSLYANSVGITGTTMPDLKIGNRHTVAQLVTILQPRRWWSCGPTGLNIALRGVIENFYNQKSKYEV